GNEPVLQRLGDLVFLRRRLDRRLLVGRLDVAQELRGRAFLERDAPPHRRFCTGQPLAYWLLRHGLPVRVPCTLSAAKPSSNVSVTRPMRRRALRGAETAAETVGDDPGRALRLALENALIAIQSERHYCDLRLGLGAV